VKKEPNIIKRKIDKLLDNFGTAKVPTAEYKNSTVFVSME